jgi:psp operon transcriptional activator
MNAPSAYNHSTTSGSRIVNVEALGQSEAFLAFSDRLSRVAPVNRPVLLIGERGTGKELAASRLHYLSPRWQTPLVTLNCAALTPSLIEAELFGHEKGAFTGAEQQRPGRFEAADGGTLFLDEIGNIPLEVQSKILRVVEYGVFERVGGTRSVEVDVRIIGATNANLAAMAAEGRFKPDLLDRLAFEVLVVPSLRERLGDIDLLVDHFAAKMTLELNRPKGPAFTRAARKQLRDYPWPGNIRELKNVVERAVYRHTGGPVDHVEIDPFAALKQGFGASGSESGAISESCGPVPSHAASASETDSLDEAVGAMEIRMLRRALQQTRFNQKKAAAVLGLTYDRLRGLMRRHAGRLDTDLDE